MRKVATALVAAIVIASTASAQVITQWTFETSLPSLSNSTTISDLAAEIGTGFASGSHASADTDWSNPAGNGSAESFSSNTWVTGDFYQFALSTTGYSGISVSWDQVRSGTGPASFKLAWSTDEVTFFDLESYSVLDSPSWSSGTSHTETSYTFDLSSITGLDDQTSLYLRLIATADAGATGGTNRVDNFTVSAIPEPSTYAAIMGLVTFAIVMFRRRQKKAA